jgi:hypothetical protein
VGLTQRSISIVVLAVLTALPVSGTVCAVLCDSAATASASAHHGSGKKCEEPARPSSEVQIQGVSEHDCSTHDAVVRQTSTAAAERASGVAAPLLAVAPVHVAVRALPALETAFAHSAPPGTAPPTTPLVLRV